MTGEVNNICTKTMGVRAHLGPLVAHLVKLLVVLAVQGTDIRFNIIYLLQGDLALWGRGQTPQRVQESQPLTSPCVVNWILLKNYICPKKNLKTVIMAAIAIPKVWIIDLEDSSDPHMRMINLKT